VVLCSAAIHGLAGDDLAIDEMYTRFGPTARICFNYLKTPALLDRHERNLRNALSGLSLRSFQKMINNTSNLNMDDVSHTILLMKRYRSDLSLEPITPIVEMALRNQFKTEERVERFNLYLSLANAEASWRLAGVVYEY
jgi:hypothetical protein